MIEGDASPELGAAVAIELVDALSDVEAEAGAESEGVGNGDGLGLTTGVSVGTRDALALSLAAGEVLAGEAAESVMTDVPDADGDAAAVVSPVALLIGLEPGGIDTRVHTFSSFTSGVPVGSVNGVMVMLHVCCIGPADVCKTSCV